MITLTLCLTATVLTACFVGPHELHVLPISNRRRQSKASMPSANSAIDKLVVVRRSGRTDLTINETCGLGPRPWCENHAGLICNDFLYPQGRAPPI